jgi:3-polyprenyl-4-hydroxybenzoate decarboxylase
VMHTLSLFGHRGRIDEFRFGAKADVKGATFHNLRSAYFIMSVVEVRAATAKMGRISFAKMAIAPCSLGWVMACAAFYGKNQLPRASR